MKIISPGLQTAIDEGTIATCVKITRKDSTVLGFTNHDVNLTVDSVEYKPAPGLERIGMNLRGNAEVSNQEFASAWVVDLPEGDIASGLYDDAKIIVFKVDWSDVTNGSVIIFDGSLGMIQWSEDGFRADTHSSMRLLGKSIGVTVTSKCRQELFNTNTANNIGACQIVKASYTYTSDITVATSKKKFTVTGFGQADDWIANGVLTWTSGLNNGLSFEVKSYLSGVVELFLPTPYIVNISDDFTVTAGCDKTLSVCQSKFNNVVNFGGFPHIKNEVNFK